MSRSVFPLCKEMLRLLPKLLYCSLQHIIMWHNVESLSMFFNGQKTWKSHGSQSGLYAGCLTTSTTSHCMALSCTWTLDHMGSDTVMQQDNVLREFTWMIVLYVGVQLSKSSKLMVCSDCVITWFEVQKKGFLDVIALPAGACYQNVFTWDEAGCLHFMPAHFLFRT